MFPSCDEWNGSVAQDLFLLEGSSEQGGNPSLIAFGEKGGGSFWVL